MQTFLGSNRAENYAQMVDNLLGMFNEMGCRMSLKMGFLHSHLDFFPPNLGDVWAEHSKHSHQNISLMEKSCQGNINPNMIGMNAGFCSSQQAALTKEERNV